MYIYYITTHMIVEIPNVSQNLAAEDREQRCPAHIPHYLVRSGVDTTCA